MTNMRTCPQREGNDQQICGSRIEATVPLWLTLGPDGTWSVYGIGGEDTKVYCRNDHLPIPDHDKLTEYVRALERQIDAEAPA